MAYKRRVQYSERIKLSAGLSDAELGAICLRLRTNREAEQKVAAKGLGHAKIRGSYNNKPLSWWQEYAKLAGVAVN